MAEQGEIKSALKRVAAVLEARPSQGKATKTAESEWLDGLKVVWRTGESEFIADAKTVMGGDESAPSPGAYARGALAACLTQAYAMTFALRSIPVKSIKVRVETDSDAGGFFNPENAPVGFTAIRYYVDVQSSVDTEIVQQAIDETDQRDSVLNSFLRPVDVKGHFQISSSADAAPSE